MINLRYLLGIIEEDKKNNDAVTTGDVSAENSNFLKQKNKKFFESFEGDKSEFY